MIVEWKAAGLCHSDEHIVTGDLVPTAEMLAMMGMDSFFPAVGGHEGAGIVAEVGPGRHERQAGRPRLGQLRAVVRSLPLLLDRPSEPLRCRGGHLRQGHDHRRHEPPSHRRRRTLRCSPSSARSAERTCVAEESVIKVDDDLPLEAVALVSCGVATGWGSAVKRADTAAGRHGGRRRHRRHRDQRRPGRSPRRRQAHHRHRPDRVQAREGDGARGDAHVVEHGRRRCRS